MRRRRLLLAVITVVGLLVAPERASLAATKEVSIQDNVYTPSPADTASGDTVRWSNNGSFVHTVTASDNSFTSGDLLPGQTFQRTFTGPATIPYFCIYHGTPAGQGMAGVIVVAADGTTTTLPAGGAGRYTPLTPARILDTRNGTGGINTPIAPGATVELQATGGGGVPSTGVTAVAMNVTVTQPTATGFLTLFPAATVRPLAANVNFDPGKTVPNLAVVKLGAGGKVAVYNSAGSSHVIVDVAGWYSGVAAGNDGRFSPSTPARILDTRDGTGGGIRLTAGASLDLQVTGRGGVPSGGVGAAVLNVAATNTTATSFLTVYPTGVARPFTANLNFNAGDTVSNRAMTKVGTGGKVTIFNNTGGVDVVVDVGGWYTDASVAGSTGAYTPLTPTRILDTRDGTGGISGVRAAGSTVAIEVAGRGGVPATGARAVILNATGTQPGGAGFLTIFPAGTARPLASDLNYAGGETRPNLVVVQLGSGGAATAGKVSLFTSAQTHVVFDVAGWFT